MAFAAALGLKWRWFSSINGKILANKPKDYVAHFGCFPFGENPHNWSEFISFKYFRCDVIFFERSLLGIVQ